MSVTWTNERHKRKTNKKLELQFLEYYQAEPILWDPNQKDHKNKLKTHDAWMRISVIMEISVADLKKKRDSLLSSYRSYKTKVKRSVSSGAGVDDVYKPVWFAYEVMDSFLGDTTKCNKTINTEGEPANVDEVGNASREGDISRGQESQNQHAADNHNENSDSNATQTIRRRKNPPELLVAGKIVKEALDTFASTVKRTDATRQPNKEVDECDLYAQLLSKKLRKMSEETRFKMMHDIDGLILRQQYGYQSETQFSPMRSSPKSETQFSPMRSSPKSNYSDSAVQYTPKTIKIIDAKSRLSTESSNQSMPASPSASYIPNQRPGTSASNYSDSAVQYTPKTIKIINAKSRLSTESSNQSMPASYNYFPIVTPNTALDVGSNIVIESNEQIYPPVVHLPNPDEYEAVSEPNIIEKAFDIS